MRRTHRHRRHCSLRIQSHNDCQSSRLTAENCSNDRKSITGDSDESYTSPTSNNASANTAVTQRDSLRNDRRGEPLSLGAHLPRDRIQQHSNLKPRQPPTVPANSGIRRGPEASRSQLFCYRLNLGKTTVTALGALPRSREDSLESPIPPIIR